MRLLYRVAAMTAVLLIFYSSPNAEKYAVIVGGTAQTAIWCDCYLLYEYLYVNGWKKDNIILLFGWGDDFSPVPVRYHATSLGLSSLTRFEATSPYIDSIFYWLRTGSLTHNITPLTDTDTLLLYLFSHGSAQDTAGGGASVKLMTTTMTDYHFATCADSVPYGLRMVLLNLCNAGGFIDNLENSKTIVCAPVPIGRTDFSINENPKEESFVWTGGRDDHGEFSFHMLNAMKNEMPWGSAATGYYTDNDNYPGLPFTPDTNPADGMVSVREAFDFMTSHAEGYPFSGNPLEGSLEPLMSDSGNNGGLVLGRTFKDYNFISHDTSSLVYCSGFQCPSPSLPSPLSTNTTMLLRHFSLGRNELRTDTATVILHQSLNLDINGYFLFLLNGSVVFNYDPAINNKGVGPVYLLVTDDSNTVKGIFPSDSIAQAMAQRFMSGTATHVEEYSNIAVEKAATETTPWTLCQNMPNPFNPSTRIIVRGLQPTDDRVADLAIYNVSGKCIWKRKVAGHSLSDGIVWDGRNIAAGVYTFRLTIGGISQEKKMILIR